MHLRVFTPAASFSACFAAFASTRAIAFSTCKRARRASARACVRAARPCTRSSRRASPGSERDARFACPFRERATHMKCRDGGQTVRSWPFAGTTGRPKCVVLTHAVVCAHASGAIAEMRLNSDDIWLHVAPLFHLVDAFAVYAITRVGGRHVILPQFDAAATLHTMQNERVTVCNMAATMVQILVSSPAVPLTDLRALRMLSCGGSPLPPATVKKALSVFNCEFFLSYGMTETCGTEVPPRAGGDVRTGAAAALQAREPSTRPALATMCAGKISMSMLRPSVKRHPLEKQMELVCSSGFPFGLLEVQLRGEDGRRLAARDVATGAVGEVMVRGPTLFDGYRNNPEANMAAFDDDGFFATGDLGFFNDDGYLTVVDRAKDMLLVGGAQIPRGRGSLSRFFNS